MAQIVINEISQNYAFNAANSSFCTVALPITSCWGPGYEDPASLGISKADELENTAWNLFPSSQEGLEKFVATYRGPAANYRAAKDFSYQNAMTLLSSGYDILVCRVCPGTHAQATITDSVSEGTLTLKAKYAGSFGNNIIVTLNKVVNRNYWNAVIYVVDSNNVRTAVENLTFAFSLDNSSDAVLHISEVESNFVKFIVSGNIGDDADFGDIRSGIVLGSGGARGSDKAADISAPEMMVHAITSATERYAAAGSDGTQYLDALRTVSRANPDVATASKLRYNEWIYSAAFDVFDILKDKLAYNPNRLICTWDDQNIQEIDGTVPNRLNAISPLHIKLMDVANSGRCAAALLSIPKCLPRAAVFNESGDANLEGYAQKLSRYQGGVDGLYTSHSALFAPWGQYTYVGTSRQNPASPAFLALLIQRAMLSNQSLQYEWLVPSSRSHNVPIGKLDYTVPKKLLDEWNSGEGTNLNVITDIPGLGVGIWGDRTLYNVPPATWNALENLSTRYLVNAIEDIVYRVGLSITFGYNNSDAYSKFYAGCTPILDTMKNCGAILDYRVMMSADINGLDQVNARTVLGKIYIKVPGIIEDIIVDLICLPQSADLSQY